MPWPRWPWREPEAGGPGLPVWLWMSCTHPDFKAHAVGEGCPTTLEAVSRELRRIQADLAKTVSQGVDKQPVREGRHTPPPSRAGTANAGPAGSACGRP
jgi:hypothetical protein